MKPTKTREETLAELAARCSEGSAAGKRFTSLVRKVIKTPRSEIEQRAKAWKESRTASTSEA